MLQADTLVIQNEQEVFTATMMLRWAAGPFPMLSSEHLELGLVVLLLSPLTARRREFRALTFDNHALSGTPGRRIDNQSGHRFREHCGRSLQPFPK